MLHEELVNILMPEEALEAFMLFEEEGGFVMLPEALPMEEIIEEMLLRNPEEGIEGIVTLGIISPIASHSTSAVKGSFELVSTAVRLDSHP